MRFIRFGGISSVNQKGYDPNMPGFHSPPARRGIYVFPLGCIEPFLLGGAANQDERTAKGFGRYVRDSHGNKISTENEEDLYTNLQGRPHFVREGLVYYPNRNFYKVYSTRKSRDGKEYWVKPSKMKSFDYDDQFELWHHLSHHLKPSQVLGRQGSWVLSTVEHFEKAMTKESLQQKLRMSSDYGEKGNINSVRGKFGALALDHLEAFIEKV